jgi:hypothetical protein
MIAKSRREASLREFPYMTISDFVRGRAGSEFRRAIICSWGDEADWDGF